jgi:hypothetical protein
MEPLLDAPGHQRSPATMPGYHRGRPPRNKGEQYPADPPTIEEIIEVMRTAGDSPDGRRLRFRFARPIPAAEPRDLLRAELRRGRRARAVHWRSL